MQQFNLIFLLCISLLVFSGVYAEDLIGKICQSTPDSRICESSLRSDPRSSTADTIGLIDIMLDVVTSKSTNSLHYVNKLIKASPPPAKSQALKYCVERLQLIIKTEVPLARSAIPAPPKFAVDAMHFAAGDAENCGNQITSSGGESTLVESTKSLIVICNISASMIATLQ